MNNPHRLTDSNALGKHRNRARPDLADFLHRVVMDEIQDRLLVVNKPFNAPVIVSGFRDLWVNFLPNCQTIDDTDTLDIAEQNFDLAIHALGLHWANDLVGQLIQCRRALRPDGLFFGALFGGQTLHELRAALAQAESDITGGLSPRVAPMAEIRDLGGLLQRAGFALPVADNVAMTVSYASPFHLMRDLRAMGETNALDGRIRHFTNRRILDRAAEIYVENHSTEAGRITATFDLVFLTGWSPDASQQKPLRPGSAKTRLSDALGVTETTLKH